MEGGQLTYRSKRKNAPELISHSSVQNVPDCVVLVEVGRTKRNVDVDRDYATRARTSKELVSNIAEMIEGSCMSTVGRTTVGSLQMVHTTTLLTTRTPDTTIGSGHDGVREREAVKKEDFRKRTKSVEQPGG
jgi:hypothetical protein